ncbi:MAG TPA: PEP-CTERM sorting domain-containing protein [Phycisphaerae bacterium]|nr:PEP-CTERM sorting domain-containing protein [Phycisphaerae bacterium]
MRARTTSQLRSAEWARAILITGLLGLTHPALARDGEIVTWGADDFGQVSNAPIGTGFTAIDSGYSNSLALTPEPATLALLALAIGACLARKRTT